MGRLRYCLPSDIVTALAVITASGSVSPDPAYGFPSLYDGLPSKPLKFTTTGPIRLVFDFGVAQRMDAFAMPNHNLDASSACIVALNNANSWAAPTCVVAMPTGADQLDGHVASPWADFTTASGYSTVGFRYLSLFVPVQTANIKIGEAIIMSHLRRFTHEPQFGGNKGAIRRYLENLRTEYGVVRVNRRRIKQRTFSFMLKGGTIDFNAMQDLADDAGGNAVPFFITANDSIKTDGGLYARLSDETAAKLMSQEEFFFLPSGTANLFIENFPIDIEEVSRSLPL